MRKARLPLAALLVFIAVSVRPSAASALEDGAHMRPPKIDLRPASGGQVELLVTVGFTGGCCFTLTTRGVTATLELPREVTAVSGPEPERYAEIVGPPGGAQQGFAAFKWHLKKADPEAVYPITVHVTTENSGEAAKPYELGKPVLCKISELDVPRPAPAFRPTAVKADVVSNRDDRFVDSVVLYYVSGLPAGVSEASADRGALRWSGRKGTGEAAGQPIRLARKYEPTVWRATLPAQQPGVIACWAVALDSEGEYTTGPVERLQIVDFAAARVIRIGAAWCLAACALAGLVLTIRGRRWKMQLSPGLFSVGAASATPHPGEALQAASANNRLNARRVRWVLAICVAAAVLLLVGGMLCGQFAQLAVLWTGSPS
jgi:hypothetical protein